jgi:acetylornithine deacetylase/succinyl-diaminopimelate desuccinylase-like protein
MLNEVLKTVDARADARVSALKEFLSIPSVSAKPDSDGNMRRCAQWLADQMTFGALDVKVMPTAGHPVVVAKNKHRPDRPTVLLYGHYDVQPPEPLDLWKSPAFEPTIRDGAIYARGAVDDKGQVWAHVDAILAWQAHGGLPVNITIIIEGEEEIGSLHLEEFLKTHREQLRADVAVISDTNQFARGLPAICYGLRGLVYMEISITGPDRDLHSGLYGGAVPNPANVLTELLATLHDKDGRVNIPGFYDAVVPLSPEERAEWKKLPFSESEFAGELKLSAGNGEAGYSTLERIWARPTCDINGIGGGWQGPGAKTVIASKAFAKVSMRLVPNQDPVVIRDLFTAALRERCPKNVKLDIHCHSYAPAVLTPMRGQAMELAANAMETGFGIRPTLVRGGGSIPVVASIKSILGIDTLLVGFGLPDDCVHAPNEKFDLESLHCGARTAAALYGELAKLKRVAS